MPPDRPTGAPDDRAPDDHPRDDRYAGPGTVGLFAGGAAGAGLFLVSVMTFGTFAPLFETAAAVAAAGAAGGACGWRRGGPAVAFGIFLLYLAVRYPGDALWRGGDWWLYPAMAAAGAGLGGAGREVAAVTPNREPAPRSPRRPPRPSGRPTAPRP